MLRLADPTLVVLVGPGASGKSAWAEEFFRPEQVVSSDRLRAVVGEGEHDLSASADAFALLEQIVAARLRRRLTTVVDTLGLDGERRRAWRALAARAGVPCVAVAFDTPAAECRRRNAARAHRIPAGVLSGQLKAYAQLRPGLDGEGFDEVVVAQPVRVVPAAVAAAARQAAPATTPAVPATEQEPGAARGTGLRFGLHLSSFGAPGGPGTLAERIREVAGAAEAAGFSSIWVMDHLRQIPQLGRPWDDMLESTTVLGYLAAATRTAAIGCLVNCVTYRNVGAPRARSWPRSTCSAAGARGAAWGPAWYEAEHAAYGWPFPPTPASASTLLEDALQVLPLLWGPGAPSFDGRRVHGAGGDVLPAPAARTGCRSSSAASGERRTLRLVARYADACNLVGDADAVRHKVGVLRRHCAEVGRDPESVEVSHLSTVLVARDPEELEREVEHRRPRRDVARWAARTNPGTVEDHVLRVRALREAGVQHVIVSLAGLWDYPAIERFAAVIAACR